LEDKTWKTRLGILPDNALCEKMARAILREKFCNYKDELMTITTPDWLRDAVFYQIFPDRFARGCNNPNQTIKFESWDSPPNPYGFKGGDLYGVIEHLDYLTDLGINAIYFNPITASASNHRYHTYDYFHIDPLLGGDEGFRALLDAAHAKGIRVVPDGVFNHASRGFWQFHHVLENGSGSPFVDWFHFNPDRLNGKKHWGVYPGDQELRDLKSGTRSFDAIGYTAWWNLPALPKFNTDCPEVREFIFDAAVHWINFGADGWRLDVAAEIDDDSFWQEFRRRVKSANPDAYIVAEIWHEAKRWLQGDQFDATMNYLVSAALMGLLVKDKIPEYAYHIGGMQKVLRSLNALEFADRIDYLLGLYQPEINEAQLNLLDSHDTARFLTVAGGDIGALKLAYFFLLTYIGAPCIYYGDEVGMDGGPDPECRKSFNWDEKTWNHDLRAYFKQLIQVRKQEAALRRGTYQRIYADADVLVYARQYNGESILVALNTGSAEKQPVVSTASLGITSGALRALFGSTSAVIRDGAITSLRIGARSGLILKVE
jgi:neopullulanase